MIYSPQARNNNPTENLISRIEDRIKNNNFSDAKKLCKKLCKNNKKNPQAWFIMSSIYAQLGEYANAAQSCRELIKLSPELPVAHFNLGLALNKLGKFMPAISSLRKTIKLQPSFIKAYVNMGDIHKEIKQFDEAVEAYISALNVEPENPEIQKRIAYVKLLQENVGGAIEYYKKIIERTPSDSNTWLLMATILASDGNLVEAEKICQQGIAANSGNFKLLCEHGKILSEQGNKTDALEAFKKAKNIQPNDAEINYLISEFSDDSESSYTDKQEYIANVFDEYAETFDSHLAKRLEYRTPELIHQISVENINDKLKKLDILDLGCGTGLCGVFFKDTANSLIGVDLSGKMIEKTRDRNLYDSLYQTDIIDALEQSENKYDLIIAADVFVYVGNLSEAFNGCNKALKKGGLLVFSVESVKGETYKLRSSGRYGHSNKYIHDLALDNKFTVKASHETTIRKEGIKPIQGYIFALQML